MQMRSNFSCLECQQLCLLIIVGLAALPYDLRALQPPSLRSVPTTALARENATVVLPCVVDNLGGWMIRWVRHDAVLAARTALDVGPVRSEVDSRVTLRSDNALQISNLQASDTGEYLCQVVHLRVKTLAAPAVLNQTHAVQVLYPPTVRLLPEVEIIQVQLGDLVDVVCQATGVPDPIVSWIKSSHGEALYSDEQQRSLEHQPRLQLRVTDRHVAGRYQCIANNEVGDPAVASVNVIVQHAPEVRADKTWVHTSPGLRAELSCTVVAEPAAKVEWIRNNLDDSESSAQLEIVRTRHFVSAEKDSLTFRHVRDSDLGNYTCRASNALGVAERTIQLSGVANRAVLKSDFNAATEHGYTLIWEVDSYSPIVEYLLKFRKRDSPQWWNVTVPAAGGAKSTLHSHTYRLHGLQSATWYEAQILSRSRFGWSKPSSVFAFATYGPGERSKVEYSKPPASPGSESSEENARRSSLHRQKDGNLQHDPVSPESDAGVNSSSSEASPLALFLFVVCLILRSQ